MLQDEFQKIDTINTQINTINRYSQILLNDAEGIIHSYPLKYKNITCAEGGFLHVISWLYIKYIDNKKSKENINFLIKKNEIYSVFANFDLNLHKKSIGAIRTYLHHDITANNKNNIKTKNITNSWFQKCCFNDIPQNEEEWRNSLNKLLDEAILFFNAISEITNNIDTDDFKGVIIEEWQTSINPFSFYDVNKIVQELAQEKGLDFNYKKYTSENYEKWNNELKHFKEKKEKKLKSIILDSFRNIH